MGLHCELDPRPCRSRQHLKDVCGRRPEYVDVCRGIEGLFVCSSGALAHDSHVELKRVRVRVHLHDRDLCAVVIRVFIECKEPRFIRLNEVTQSRDALSFSIELSVLEPIGRDEDEWAVHQPPPCLVVRGPPPTWGTVRARTLESTVAQGSRRRRRLISSREESRCPGSQQSRAGQRSRTAQR